jgi:ferric-dicitrate binding protein FerR (iron transport regulator)
MTNKVQWTRGRSVVALISAMLAAPLMALSGESLGVVRSSGTVYVDNSAVTSAAQISSGDRLETKSSSATVALPMGSMLRLDPRSSVTVNRLPDGVHIALDRGQLTFSSAPSEGVHIQADGVTVSPQSADSGLAEIALNNDGSMRMAVRSGSMTVTDLAADPVFVKAGHFINVSPRVSQNEQAGTAAGGKLSTQQKVHSFQIGSLSHNASVALVAIAVGAIITGIVLGTR